MSFSSFYIWHLMQIINVSEVHRIGGLCPVGLVATRQIEPHNRRPAAGTAVDPKVKGGLVVCLSGLGDDGRNSSPCHAP